MTPISYKQIIDGMIATVVENTPTRRAQNRLLDFLWKLGVRVVCR